VLVVIGMLTSDPQPATAPATTAAPTPQAKATSPAATKPPATEPAETAPGIGQRARDGKFELVVSRVRRGVQRIGSQYLNKTAQASSASSRCGSATSPTSSAPSSSPASICSTPAAAATRPATPGLYLEDSKSFLEDINPGNGVNGTLVYDVPKNFKPAKIELHDAAFSGGVEVTLR
jgi:pyruvate/2-oxoglutarate dehydrogenase complex dihydrolipoamide acyltransferase (E2) component